MIKLKAFVLVAFAIFFSLLVFNNITNYESNHWVVKSVLGMEGVQDSAVTWRAIKAPWIVTPIYIFIIMIEAMVSVFCWISVFFMLVKRNGWFFGFAGLAMAFGLFMLGFVAIAGEWFYMWQHPIFGGMQQKAAVYSILMLASMLFVKES